MGWFLLGLIAGCGICGGYVFYRNRRLLREIQSFTSGHRSYTVSPVSRLGKAIAHHQHVAQLLQQELHTLQHLFHIAPIGFLQVDDENQLISCNAKACELLKLDFYQPEKPRLLLEVVRSFELDALIEQTRLAQTRCQDEWLFHPVDADFAVLSQQQPQPLRGYGIPLPQGCVGIFLESREETVMLERQRDRWISDVAHELKTPLTSIRLVAETLQTRLEPPARDWIERLLREAIRLGNLVQDLLDLNQLQAYPNARLTYKTVDLASMVHTAWISLEPLASEKRIQLEYIGAEQILIQADEARLHRVLLNLLDNSIKYSPANQQIRVQIGFTQPPRDGSSQCVQIEVIDAGLGFPEDALPFVFERFYRVDPSRTRPSTSLSASSQENGNTRSKTGSPPPTVSLPSTFSSLSSGNGLGLAIVRQIVEAHHGWVTASNHPETGGAWLQVVLPCSPESGD